MLRLTFAVFVMTMYSALLHGPKRFMRTKYKPYGLKMCKQLCKNSTDSFIYNEQDLVCLRIPNAVSERMRTGPFLGSLDKHKMKKGSTSLVFTHGRDICNLQDKIYWGDWLLVLRAQRDIGTSVYATWTDDVTYPGGPTLGLKPGCVSMNTSLPCDTHYKSKVVAMWETADIKKVKVLMLKNSQVRKEILFEGADANKMSWFSADHLINSTWTDLTPSSGFNFFSIKGERPWRHFYINRNFNGCPNDVNWLTVLDGTNEETCPWDTQALIPKFMYSKSNTSARPSIQNDFEYGDVMAILVK